MRWGWRPEPAPAEHDLRRESLLRRRLDFVAPGPRSPRYAPSLRRVLLISASAAVALGLLVIIAPWTDAITPFGCALANDCRHPVDATPVQALGALCLTGILAALWGATSALRGAAPLRRQLAIVATAALTLIAAGIFSQTVRMDYGVWKTVVGVNAFE